MGGTFSSGTGAPAAPLSEESLMESARQVEMQATMELLNKLLETCHKKCITTEYFQPDLSKGEALCVDRCTAKYFDVTEIVQKKMQESQVLQQ